MEQAPRLAEVVGAHRPFVVLHPPPDEATEAVRDLRCVGRVVGEVDQLVWVVDEVEEQRRRLAVAARLGLLAHRVPAGRATSGINAEVALFLACWASCSVTQGARYSG